MEQDYSLNNLPPNKIGVITSINSTGSIRRRLGDLGFVKGSKVEYVSKSPLGDPTAYYIKGTVIALREEDSSQINIQLS